MMLTVFTPTYNRAYILPKLYTSLQSQTRQNFEWLIIDDDSSDNTKDLIENWKKENNLFQIRYFKQVHGGKHRAINKAVDIAKGEFFFIVDSDDSLTSDAIEKVTSWIKGLNNLDKYAGVAGLRIDQSGNIIGGMPSFDENTYKDVNNLERQKYNLLGDKAEIYKTSILKEFKFPEFKNEYFVTEAVCWNSIALAGYKIRWYNSPIYVCEYLADGLSKGGMNDLSGHLKNFNGFVYYADLMLNNVGIEENIRLFLTYIKVCKKKKMDLKGMAEQLHMNRNQFICHCFKIPYIIMKKRVGKKCKHE